MLNTFCTLILIIVIQKYYSFIFVSIIFQRKMSFSFLFSHFEIYKIHSSFVRFVHLLMRTNFLFFLLSCLWPFAVLGYVQIMYRGIYKICTSVFIFERFLVLKKYVSKIWKCYLWKKCLLSFIIIICLSTDYEYYVSKRQNEGSNGYIIATLKNRLLNAYSK